MITPDDFSAIELSRYELKLRTYQPASLPSFLGSTLRGAFGHALKEAVCVMSHRDCAKCLVADRCIYPYLFETSVPADVPQLRGQQQAPHPFILMPPVFEPPEKQPGAQQRVSDQHLPDGRMIRLVRSPIAVKTGDRRRLQPGDNLTFGLTLMGRATEYLPYVVYAVSEMARRGLGFDRTRFELTEVAMIDEDGARRTIYSGATERISVPASATMSLSDLVRLRLDRLAAANDFRTDAIRLKFLTPTRIRVEGDLQVGMSFELCARNLLRRASLLAAVHGGAQLRLDYRRLIALAGGVSMGAFSLRWSDWERYSNRQQTKMNMGGFTGEVEYCGEAIKEFLPLIAACELLHIGAGTSFGLGRYEIIALQAFGQSCPKAEQAIRVW